MSHFSVLVIGGNVEEQLQPYHEFECTGTDDQYVQEIDKTEEARAEWLKHEVTRYRDPEGNLHDPFTPEGNWDSRFWRELTPEEKVKYPGTFHQDYDENEEHGGLCLYSCDWHDGKEYHTKAFQWPSEGWSEVKVPDSTVRTFADFCEDYYGHKIVPFGEQPRFVPTKTGDGRDKDNHHKYGYTLVDAEGNVVKTVDRTNPNRKWDWYSVGGRWNGHFKLKPLAVGIVGAPGLNKMDSSYEEPGEDRADILMKGDIDFDSMRAEAAEKAADRWDRFHAIIAGLPEPMTWQQAQEKHRTGGTDEDGEPKVDYKAAREEFHAQPAVQALRTSKDRDAIWWEVDEFMVPREQFVQHWRDRAGMTFAYVKDGVWHEKGRMGWWGIVSDEQAQEVWNRQFSEMLDSLPDNTLLTIVDCHI